jgi:hypothetical protein
MPAGVKSIGKQAFAGCASLKSARLPAGMERVGEGAFTGCNGLESITCAAATPPVLEGRAFGYHAMKTVAARVPREAIAAYRSAAGWGEFDSIIDIRP